MVLFAPMRNVVDRIAAANTLLAPYAVPHEGTLGRNVSEDLDATRFPFQRDRDRIIHSKAFRRLKGKTQVFVSGGSDHFRTRLTHTMEVAQISRDMARTLGLNEDLAECIALAHDLGHPPFGHAGEEALDRWMKTHRSSFEHNRQSLRIVTILDESSSQRVGLNLNQEVLEGLMKHRTPHDKPEESVPRNPTLEALVVNIADEIAYTGHDVDDGLRAGLFTTDDLRSLPVITRIDRATHGSLRGGLIDLMVSDIYNETERNITEQDLRTLDDVYASNSDAVRFSEALRSELSTLRTFLWQQMYMHPDVIAKTEEGKQIVTTLCTAFFAHPDEKITALMERTGSTLEEAVKDYVCGMTDEYARSTVEAVHRQQGGTLAD